MDAKLKIQQTQPSRDDPFANHSPSWWKIDDSAVQRSASAFTKQKWHHATVHITALRICMPIRIPDMSDLY